ncbi:hypothetical protein SEA_PERIWINKLE_85 [Gordonia phage Periwinkle]|nr:hypothetical protein SEA_PERIWINKLE_85 [Gordonia phage Periwinkle]
MSGDPAIAAWERSAAKTSPLDALAAAREMAAPVRKLHIQSTRIPSADYRRCITCHTSWPCDTARLLYSSSELEGTSDAQ